MSAQGASCAAMIMSRKAFCHLSASTSPLWRAFCCSLVKSSWRPVLGSCGVNAGSRLRIEKAIKAKTVPLMKSSFSLPALGCIGVLLTGVLASGAAWAERADREKPMNIESDALRYEDQQQLSTFTGRVVATKGTIVMRGSRLEVRQDAAGNQLGVMYAEPGKRAFFRQKREGLDEYIEGEGETIEYDSKADTVRFLRRAEMRRLAGSTLQDEVRGAVIVYNNTTEVYTVDGAPRSSGTQAGSGGRVRATLAPRGTPAPASGAETAVPLRPSVRQSQ